MNRLLTPQQMSQAEKASEALGVSLWELMQNAGAQLARAVERAAARIGAKNILLLCGSGNNGGDGSVCASLLADKFDISAAYVCGEPKTELAKKAFALIDSEKVKIITENIDFGNADIVVDCIFGTGFHGEFRENIQFLMSRFARSDTYKIACDMPSGVDCLRGKVAAETVKFDETITFHAMKFGMALKPAFSVCGKIEIANIGIPDGWEKYLDDRTSSHEIFGSELHKMLPARPEYSHKGTFGKVLLICGSENYIGAAAICSRAALHTGCGIVNLAAPHSVISIIAASAPECVYTPLETEGGTISSREIDKLVELANMHSAVVVGCGIGRSESTRRLVEALVKNVRVPLLIDADGINQLALNIDVLRDKNCEIVLTPHIGELARLSGRTAAEASAERYAICRELSEKYGVTLHSKDATSVTFSNSKATVTNFGCSALAKGGSGDMLAGVIASLLAQGVTAAEACALGDYICGETAEILCEKYSPAAVAASDIINAFKETLTIL